MAKKPRPTGVFFMLGREQRSAVAFKSFALRLLKGLYACLLLLALAACETQTRRPLSTGAELATPAVAPANSVAFRAFSLVGTPYVYGGENPSVGFDCSGFVRYIYRDALNLDLPRTAAAQSERGKKVFAHAALRLGDLVFFQENQRIFHVGLYVGEGRFVHAPRTGKSIELSPLDKGYWNSRFVFGRRIL